MRGNRRAGHTPHIAKNLYLFARLERFYSGFRIREKTSEDLPHQNQLSVIGMVNYY